MRLQGKTMDMTSGNIRRQLLLFALPLMAENLFQLLYNTVDSIIVGRFVGKDALAAVGATTYVIFFFTGGLIGLSAGITAVAARHFGAQRDEELQSTVRTSFSLAVIFGAALLLIGQWSVAPTLVLTKIPPEINGLVAGYLRVCYVGLPAVALFNVGGGILRAVGNSRQPVLILIFTSLVNILLDLVFVVGFRGGVCGAAWATVIAQYVSAGMVLFFLARRRGVGSSPSVTCGCTGPR